MLSRLDDASQPDSEEYLKCVYDAIDAASAELRTLSLQTKGFAVEQGGSGLATAFVARTGKHSPNVTVGICSEYDALPGIGHACGHNLIAISGVAAALGIKAAIDRFGLDAEVRLLGTPGEERAGGKTTMYNSGDFNNLDVCMMVHGANADVLYTPFLALVAVEVEYFGQASQTLSEPWEGINALDAAVQAYVSIGLLRQQLEPHQRIHGNIQNGGDSASTIPVYTKSLYLIRAPQYPQLEELQEKLNRIFQAAAEVTGCTLKHSWNHKSHDILTNEPLVLKFEKYMNSLGVVYASKEEQQSKLTGSTDMGNITYAIPGIHPMFNIFNLEGRDEHSAGLHTVEFAAAAVQPVAHATTLRAAKALAMTGLQCILDGDFLRHVKEKLGQESA
ncbi:hypothetical protein BGW38_009475 [Lunasporangiospora selenospora]|uniref:Peptidase M20 domain-containing protein 2 n=1 Tax=Lunasporangiospora selenospora TaxID=979761 RepID=A0A9P6KJB7_9FUNG|nr:hypothetical protein BGW38_009475 [Lunasporangiospora selenospora]